MEEVNKWVKRAERDLFSAKVNLREGLSEVAAFLAHQAAEKALKALHILKYRELRKIHDLVKLAEGVGAPAPMVDICKKLNPHYLATRYPLEVEYTEEKAKEAVDAGEKVLEWVKKNL